MWRTLKIVCGIVVALIAAWLVLVLWPVNDGHTPAQRRVIAEACLAMLHSSLTNEMDDIPVNDPRVPQVIRDLHPHSISVIPGFHVDIYSNGKPPEYFLSRIESQHAWILFAAGPGVKFGAGGGVEVYRIPDN